MTAKWYRIVCTLLRIAITGLVAQSAGAAGFYIPEVGTPTSLGTGGVSNPTNTYHADSAWTNPAGMTGLERDSMLAGLQVVVPKAEFDTSIATAGGGDGGNAGNTAVIPGFFYVRKLSDRARFGLSLVAPQGGGFKYGDDFAGRYQASKATLAAVGISPSLAYRISDRFSIGAGVSIIYTKFEQSVMINQAALVGPGTPDGKVRIDNATDWGYQPFLGFTLRLTDRVLLGVIYRAEMDVKLEGDLNFRNLVIPNPAANDIELKWDNPQWLEAGLRYRMSAQNYLFVNAGWQDWSAFGERNEVSTSGEVATLDRQWNDTWHAGIALGHVQGKSGYSLGLSYESSPVDDKHRTFDLPVDEIYKLSGSWLWKGSKQLDFSLGATLYLVGDANIDVTAQGVRAAGKFDRNNILFLGGTVRYFF